MSDEDEITLKQAAQLARLTKASYPATITIGEPEHPANVPGAEATAVLETMLAAGRKRKVVKG